MSNFNTSTNQSSAQQNKPAQGNQGTQNDRNQSTQGKQNQGQDRDSMNAKKSSNSNI